MSDRTTLLANCLADPADDTARLVYADWLREQDSPLGRFLWAGVTLSRFRGNEPVADGMFFDAQRDLNETAPGVLAGQLEALFGWDWQRVGWDNESTAPDRLTAALFNRAYSVGRLRAASAPGQHAVYERGMLHALRLTLGRWREVAAAVLAACPLERVDALDVPGLTFAVLGPTGGWRLSGELKLAHLRSYDLGPAPHGRIAPTIRSAETMARVMPTAEACPEGLTRDRLAAVHVVALTDQIVAELRDQADDRWPGSNEEGDE